MSTRAINALILFFIMFILLFTVFALCDRRVSSPKRRDYDERQRQMHGVACKWGFYTLISLLLGYAAMSSFLPVETSIAIILCVVVATGVYGGICIATDAYVSMRNNFKLLCVSFSLIGISNLALGVLRILDGSIIRDGRLSIHSANLACGALMFVLLAMLVIHRLRGRRSEEE